MTRRSSGFFRLVVDNPQKAKETLTHLGFVVRITDVVGVELKDEKGNLNRMLSILADGQINLNYIYSFVIRDGSAPVMVFSTEMTWTGPERFFCKKGSGWSLMKSCRRRTGMITEKKWEERNPRSTC